MYYPSEFKNISLFVQLGNMLLSTWRTVGSKLWQGAVRGEGGDTLKSLPVLVSSWVEQKSCSAEREWCGYWDHRNVKDGFAPPVFSKSEPPRKVFWEHSMPFSARWNRYVRALLAIFLLTSGNFKAPIHQGKGPWMFPLLIFQLARWAYS